MSEDASIQTLTSHVDEQTLQELRSGPDLTSEDASAPAMEYPDVPQAPLPAVGDGTPPLCYVLGWLEKDVSKRMIGMANYPFKRQGEVGYDETYALARYRIHKIANYYHLWTNNKFVPSEGPYDCGPDAVEGPPLLAICCSLPRAYHLVRPSKGQFEWFKKVVGTEPRWYLCAEDFYKVEESCGLWGLRKPCCPLYSNACSYSSNDASPEREFSTVGNDPSADGYLGCTLEELRNGPDYASADARSPALEYPPLPPPPVLADGKPDDTLCYILGWYEADVCQQVMELADYPALLLGEPAYDETYARALRCMRQTSQYFHIWSTRKFVPSTDANTPGNAAGPLVLAICCSVPRAYERRPSRAQFEWFKKVVGMEPRWYLSTEVFYKIKGDKCHLVDLNTGKWVRDQGRKEGDE
uniref:Structural maintenance of chromosomes protein n=1 Tax=Ganoderma boninense TaxID=34458 RepID=A0A5K1JVR7_9APHY|nr:Structural maintenance of chromosomes protein [Ganoderma boninense]